jgi:beta-mannosidase
MQKQVLELNGKWQYKEYPACARRMRDLDGQDWLDCSVPSSIYECLVNSGKIKLSDLRARPGDFLWPSEKSWIFQKFFDRPEELSALDTIEMVFDGLDTFCQIWLNDKLVAKTDNMFRSYRFDVKKLLKEKNNRLLVKCESPLENGERLMNRFGVLSDDKCSLPCRTYVRKAQCQFGWDWAPALPGCGIWQSVRIEGFSLARLKNIHIRTVDADSAMADVKVSVQVEKFVNNLPVVCKLTVFEPTGDAVSEAELDFSDGNKNVSAVLKIKKPMLWQPAGYGDQPIYNLRAELVCDNQIAEISEKSFGIRTIQLNQAPDELGSPFQFIVNNQPIYVRGAAWIPASLFIGSTTDGNYEKLLGAAKEANINMLRVWGGGIYETETFYNLCDRLGIMVWQDFTFACAYYPDRSWFTDMIKTEAAQNITRLRNHPSLVLWCGNNEIDWLVSSSCLNKGKKFYGREIYHKILPRIVHELDPDRDYITSTPLGPGKNPNDSSTGTVHQWNIWSGLEPSDNYITSPQQTPRFVAEFGFQALPDRKTLQSFLPNEKLHPASESIERHNYQPGGTARIQYYINELFRPPANVEELIYLSQVTQARAIRKNIEHLRSNSRINSGALYWQFNDCCPSISWSCIDYRLRPKALYYYTKRFFAPAIISVSAKYNNQKMPMKKTIESLTGFIINHSSVPLTGLFICRLVDMNLNTIDEFKRPASASPYETVSFALPQSFVKTDRLRDCFIYLLFENDNVVAAENSFFYMPDKYINWPAHKIDIQTERVNDYNWRLTLKPGCAIKDLYIDLPFEAELSDNFFDLLTKETKIVTIRTRKMIDDLPKKICLTCVNSIFTV